MFDQDDYYSDQQDNVMYSSKNVPSSKVLVPNTGSDFNLMAGQGQSLMKMMKQRGLDLNQNEMKKMKQPRTKQKSQPKTKPKTGFFDGGDKASIQQLIKALNKAFSQADPQQASCILSYLLQKKNLGNQDRNKFSIMKCNILFGLGAYEDCLQKAQSFLQKPHNKLSAAIYSNLMAKCKSQTNKLLSGYIDYLRAVSLLQQYKQQQSDKQKLSQSTQSSNNSQNQIQQKKQIKPKNVDEYAQSQIDTTMRQINHTQMQYNIKMSGYKNSTNLIFPYFPQFRHRKVLQVVCGDYHSLFLVGGALTNKAQKTANNSWTNQVFGYGQNTVGQITGRQRKVIYKQPVLISQLSGKGIQGIWASRQSSLACDANGNIYEWGIKQKRNQLIEITYTLGQQILKLQKGYKHYAALTKSGKFYSWGTIEMKGTPIYTQNKPQLQDSKNIINFSCGSSHTVAVDSHSYAFSLGSNDQFQLGIPSQKLCKSFKKIDNNMIGDIKKVFCINDCTFLVNTDMEVFFCGKYSLKRQAQQRFRQAEFGDQFKDIILITGSTGTYYMTSQLGNCYKWDVDNMVKFKIDRDNQNITQRYVEACRGNLFKVRSMINPQFCKAVRATEQLRTYEPINYLITLRDQYGLYGVSDLIIPPKCQIFLSTYKAKKQQLQAENKLFVEGHNFCTTSNKILLNQIIQNRLLQFQINRDQQQPWIAKLKISIQASGRYYFYIILEQTILLQQELEVQVSERQKQLQDKNKQQRLLKQQERRRKAELQRQRLAQQKLRKQQQQQERRRQTQRRAEQALKKHMREQQQVKLRQQQDRKARKQLMTGGGFDLTKLKKKSSQQPLSATLSATMTEKLQKVQRIERMQKTNESFLPDINVRPSSRKKATLPKPSQLIGAIDKATKPAPLLKSGTADFSSTGFSLKQQNPNQNSTTIQRGNSSKQKQRQPIITATSTSSSGAFKSSKPKNSTTVVSGIGSTTVGTTGTGIVKRGLSKKKNG